MALDKSVSQIICNVTSSKKISAKAASSPEHHLFTHLMRVSGAGMSLETVVLGRFVGQVRTAEMRPG